MTVMFNNQTIFCNSCGSNDMVFFDDEFIQEVTKSESVTCVKCNRCNNMFSKEYIEEHTEEFTDEDKRQEIIARARAKSERYNKFDEEREKQEHEFDKRHAEKQAKQIEKAKHESEQGKL